MSAPFSMRLYAQILRILPIYSGLTKLSFNALINRAFGDSPGSDVAKVVGGVNIEVPLNDYHGRILYLFGSNDRKVSAVVNSLLAPGDCFLDIGANFSSIGIAASPVVGPRGSVHLFEPQRRIADAVIAGLSASTLSNVTLHRIGLADQDCSLDIRYPRNHSGMATLVSELQSDGWVSEAIAVRETGGYIEPLVGEAPIGAKVDVEGMEPAILPALLSHRNLKFCVVEGAWNKEILFDLACQHDFSIYGLERSIFIPSLTSVENLDSFEKYHDLVFIRYKSSTELSNQISPIKLSKKI